MNNNEEPNYVLKANEAVLKPTKQSNVFRFIKIGVLIVVILIILGSIIFQDNLFSELSWTTRILLIILVIGVTLWQKKEYEPSPMELQFYNDYLILFLPKRYYSKRVTRKEINLMKYSEITKCVYKTQSKRIHLYGNGTSIWYNYKADGTISKTPTEERNYNAGLIYFNTNLATDVDFVKEIQEHSPIKVEIEEA